MNNLSYTKLLIFIVIIIFVNLKMYGQYPCTGCIFGNIGEESHNPKKNETPTARYHYGIDFGQGNGNLLVEIETGPLRWMENNMGSTDITS